MNGGSVGVYVKNVLDNQGGIVSATSGHFSADVELTANFGGGSLPVQQSVHHRMERSPISSCNMARQNDWAVKLGLADFSVTERDENAPGESLPGGNAFDYTNTFSGETIGDSTAAPWFVEWGLPRYGGGHRS